VTETKQGLQHERLRDATVAFEETAGGSQCLLLHQAIVAPQRCPGVAEGFSEFFHIPGLP
jgi:hypothetical protein